MKNGGRDLTKKRVELYDRLPGIYRERDFEQHPRYQLKHFLGIFEDILGHIQENIESMYDEYFIETCRDWAVFYLGDLLGTSHLRGDPWTIRADVADSIALRRRKGTLGAIEKLTYDLTGWGVHCVEIRNRMLCTQNINFFFEQQASGLQTWCKDRTRGGPLVNGTVNLKDPFFLSLAGSSFGPFAHFADFKPPNLVNFRYNLPNLIILLWRLQDFQIQSIRPPHVDGTPRSQQTSQIWSITKQDGREQIAIAQQVVGFYIHPLGRELQLFNNRRTDFDQVFSRLTDLDETPCPVEPGRLAEGSNAGDPVEYVSINTYSDTRPITITDKGLQLHLPASDFYDDSWPHDRGPKGWKLRGESLEKWERTLVQPLVDHEIVIDPTLGRILVGLDSLEKANALRDGLRITHTYGAVGPVGGHPSTATFQKSDYWSKAVLLKVPSIQYGSLEDAIRAALSFPRVCIVEIKDSLIHDLDIEDIPLSGSLWIRAAQGHRPIIRLHKPLRLAPRPYDNGIDTDNDYSDFINTLNIRLEGLFITRSPTLAASQPLIERLVANRIEILNTTIDPLAYSAPGESNGRITTSMRLEYGYGFVDESKEDQLFKQIPEIEILNSITGILRIDTDYNLEISNSIIDAGAGVRDQPGTYAIIGTDSTSTKWGPKTKARNVTIFGEVKVEEISGRGIIFVHPIAVQKTLRGCLKYCYIVRTNTMQIPQIQDCLYDDEANPGLLFVSEEYGNPHYAQLAHDIDYRIKGRGPEDNEMGAFGFLCESDKWRNIQVRFREFMPVGIRPVFVTVT